MSDGPTRYYLYIPVWATGTPPQGGGSSQYSSGSGSAPSETQSSSPSMPSSEAGLTAGPVTTPYHWLPRAASIDRQ
jgi:hypothetical protein